MSLHPVDDRQALDEALFAGPSAFIPPPEEQPAVVAEEPSQPDPYPVVASYVYQDEPPPLPASLPTLATLGELTVPTGEQIVLTREHIVLTGPEPALIDIMLLSAPEKGALLRDGFALTGGDVFTQQDIDQGRLTYRHEGEPGSEDRFVFATPNGEVQPTEAHVRVLVPPHQAPELGGPGLIDSVCQGCTIATVLADGVPQPMGIALVGTAGRGRWQRAEGDGWVELPEVQHGKALLLGPDDRLRFVPRAGWGGGVKITFRAWDLSAHAAGDVVNLASRASVGGETAFSHNTASATTTIEAPGIEERPEPPAPWRAQPSAAEITGEGLAVVRLQGEGSWRYSLDDGKTWRDFGTVYHGKARLLRAGDRLRFVPRPGARGKVVLTCRSWDGTGAVAGDTISLATARSVGDTSPFGEMVLSRSWWLDRD